MTDTEDVIIETPEVPTPAVEPNKEVETPEVPTPAVEDEEPEVRKDIKEDTDYGEDIDPEDIKTIGTIVDKKMSAVRQTIQEQQDMSEVAEFIADNPEYAKYKPSILKYLQHPVYSKIPVSNIAAIVASKDLMKLGAEKERAAQNKADATHTGGSGSRSAGGGTPDWSTAPKDTFEAKKAEVLSQR